MDGLLRAAGHSPELQELKEHLHAILRCDILVLCGVKLGSVVHVGPLQLRMFCDSVLILMDVIKLGPKSA